MSLEQPVEFWDQGKLAGILHLPTDSNQIELAIIFCPGKNGERYEAHRLAVKFGRRLSQNGIAFFRFDYFGLGLSDGEFIEMTTTTKVSNVIKAKEYIMKNYNISTDRICFIGFSDGARVALLASNRVNVNKLILWSPVFYEINNGDPNKDRPIFKRHPYFKKHLVIPWAGLWSPLNFYKDLNQFDIEKEISNFKGKSCLIYDDQDLLIIEEHQSTDVHNSKLFRNKLNNYVEIISGAGHLFSSVYTEALLMERTEKFLKHVNKVSD